MRAPRLPRAGAGRRARHRPTSRCCGRCSSRPASAIRLYADPAWRPAAAGPSWTRRCATGCARPSPARTSSWPTPRRSPASPAPRARTSTCSPGCWTAPRSSTGLAVDTELRWQLLHRLVAAGAAGEAEIDAELASDRTDAGERYAHRGPGRDPDRGGQGAGLGRDRQRRPAERDVPGRAARLPGPRTRTSCSRRTSSRTSRRWPACGRTGRRTWRSSSPRRLPGTAISQPTIDRHRRLPRGDQRRAARCARLLIEDRDDVARALRCRSGDARPGPGIPPATRHRRARGGAAGVRG